MRRLLLPLPVVLLTVGCATVASVTRPATTALGRVLLSSEEEQRLGNELAAQVRQKEKVLEAPEVQAYVERIGQRIVAQVPAQERRFPFRFTVLDAPDTVNAFALPGGHIFIYSGLIRAADSEAELAAVLGHEVAHVTSRHPSDMLAAQVGAGALQQLALGREPGLLSQLGSAIATQGYLAAYSRDAEEEADKRGLQFLAQAGFQPEAMVQFFRKLARLSGSSPRFVGAFLATHPEPGRRAEEVASLIRSRGYPGGEVSLVGDLESIQAQLGETESPRRRAARRPPPARR